MTRFGVLVCAVAAGMGSCGCGLESGYEELGRELADRGEPRLEVPGRRLLAGDFKRSLLDWAGSNDSGEPVLAVVDDDDMLSLVRPESGERCTVGPAAYLWEFSGGRAEQVASGKGSSVFIYFESFDWVAQRGTMKFASPNCEPLEPELPGAGLPLGSSNQMGIVTDTAEGELWALDPWAGTGNLLSAELGQLLDLGDELWTIEAGELVYRDLETGEERRFGSGVESVSYQYRHDTPTIAYDDDQGVHALDLDPESDELLEVDACEPRMLSDYGSGAVGYLSPCDERKLVARDLATGKSIAYDAIVSSGPIARGKHLYYVSDGEPRSGFGTLYRVPLLRGDDDTREPVPQRLVENALLDWVVIWQEQPLVIVDWDGDSGRLVRIPEDGEAIEMARDVAMLSWGSLLANFDGVAGDQFSIQEDFALRLLATRVPLRANDGNFMLAEFDGTTGALFEYVWQAPAGSYQLVAQGVPLGGYRSLYDLGELGTGFGYLTDFDAAAGTGRLNVRVPDASEVLDFGSGVAGFSSTIYPYPGLIYRVRGGDQAGIWYAIVQ